MTTQGYDYSALGKHVARINLYLILFASFAITALIDLEEVNRNITEAFRLQGSLKTDVSDLHQKVAEARAIGSGATNAIWPERLGDTNLLQVEMDVKTLREWTQVFIDQEPKEPAQEALFQVMFQLNAIEIDQDNIRRITGADCRTIDAATTAINTYLRDTKIDTVKLPILNKNVQYSLLQNVVPLVEIVFLANLSIFLIIGANLFKSIEHANEFSSQTILFVNVTGNLRSFIWLIRGLRFISPLLCLITIGYLDVLRLSAWQFWLLLAGCGLYGYALMLYDRAIGKLPVAEDREESAG